MVGIKEKPKTCGDCIIRCSLFNYCTTEEQYENLYNKECPLIELPHCECTELRTTKTENHWRVKDLLSEIERLGKETSQLKADLANYKAALK